MVGKNQIKQIQHATAVMLLGKITMQALMVVMGLSIFVIWLIQSLFRKAEGVSLGSGISLLIIIMIPSVIWGVLKNAQLTAELEEGPAKVSFGGLMLITLMFVVIYLMPIIAPQFFASIVGGPLDVAGAASIASTQMNSLASVFGVVP